MKFIAGKLIYKNMPLSLIERKRVINLSRLRNQRHKYCISPSIFDRIMMRKGGRRAWKHKNFKLWPSHLRKYMGI